jgi:hypothetical protein
MKTIWRGLRLLGLATLVLVLVGLTFFFMVKAILKPAAGAWATTVHAGPVTVQVGVPTLIWLATTPWVAPRLDGRQLPTRMGTVRLRWQADSRTLSLRCQPCTVSSRGWGGEVLHIAQAQLSVRRQGSRLEGELVAGQVRASWRGTLTPRSLDLQVELPWTPIRDGYALFASVVPELEYARIDGLFGLSASVALPANRISLTPRVQGFAVQGLNTGALMGARSSCSAGRRMSRLGVNSRLARAVIAAEDQRFFEHTGFDLVELAASFELNQRTGQIERGASTLSQQLARLLVTGGERTPGRKLRELLYAVEMEQTLGKARILRLYLDHAPWGKGLCGADAAARHYFGIQAKELDAAQAVWLAAMLHQPAREAARWASTGHINVARAQRVAASLRPMPRPQREALVSQLAAVTWPAPGGTSAAAR